MSESEAGPYVGRTIETLLKTQLAVTLKTIPKHKLKGLVDGQSRFREEAFREVVSDVAKALLRSFEMAGKDPVTGMYLSSWDDPKELAFGQKTPGGEIDLPWPNPEDRKPWEWRD